MFKKLSIFALTLLALPALVKAQVPTLYTTTAATHSLIQAEGSQAVYYLAENGKRYVFPNEKTYKTWYADFSEVQVITLGELQQYPIGGNVTYRPGTRLVKITTDPKTYAVEPGGVLRWITSEQVAIDLYGSNWAQLIDDVPDPFFVNYTVSDNDIDTAAHPVGTLISYTDASDVYVIEVEDSVLVKRKLDDLSDNNYREEFVHTIDSSFTYPDGSDVTGAETQLQSPLATAVDTPDASDQTEEDLTEEQPVDGLAENRLFVDNRVTVSGNGSFSSPFKTIAEGLASMQSGMTLYIRGSADVGSVVYAESLAISGSGSIVAPRTVAAYPGERVVVTLSDTLELDEAWWRIQDIVFDNQDRSTNAIEISGDSVVIDDIEVMNGLGDGITVVSATNNVTIADSTIQNFRDCIVVMPKAKNVTISGSHISNCSQDGIDVHAEAGTAFENLPQTVTIIGNDISSSIASDNGIHVKGVIGGIISLNDIHGFTSGRGLLVTNQSHSITISDNRFYESDKGLEVRVSVNTPRAVDIFNNQFFDITGSYAMRFDGVEGGLRVIHNTLVDITGAPFMVQSLGISSGQIRNNLISNAGANIIDPGTQKAVVSNNGWFAGALAGDLGGSDNVEGSDAGFVDAGSNDYHLATGSLAIDAGIELGYIGTDFDNNPREVGADPDLGAYEVQ